MDAPEDRPCLAERYQSVDAVQGPHSSHFFTYGPNGMYLGHCGGRK